MDFRRRTGQGTGKYHSRHDRASTWRRGHPKENAKCVLWNTAAPHAINLFDMNQKYADIVSYERIIEYIQTLSGRLFPEWVEGGAAER